MEYHSMNLLCEQFPFIDKKHRGKTITIGKSGQKPIARTILFIRKTKNKLLNQVQLESQTINLSCKPFLLIEQTTNKLLNQLQFNGQGFQSTFVYIAGRPGGVSGYPRAWHRSVS